MAYADSAIDYTWEILRINVAQRLMQVKYSTADSARPEVVLNLEPLYDEFNESDLTTIAEDNVFSAVREWDKVLEAVNANPSFDPTTLEGNSYNSRYKVRTFDAFPQEFVDFNPMIQRFVTYDSEGPDEIRQKHTLYDLNDSDKTLARFGVVTDNGSIWQGLVADGRLDSAAGVLGLTGSEYNQFDVTDVRMIIGSSIQFGDSISGQLQGMYGYNDSDWAAWLISNGGIQTQ